MAGANADLEPQHRAVAGGGSIRIGVQPAAAKWSAAPGVQAVARGRGVRAARRANLRLINYGYAGELPRYGLRTVSSNSRARILRSSCAI